MGDKKLNLKWMVYYNDINSRKITTFNIFDHYTFSDYVSSHLKRCTDREEFAKKLRSELFYYFGSKCEYEVVIKPWGFGDDAKKIDIYDQVMNNWDVFLDYVWTNGRARKRSKREVVDLHAKLTAERRKYLEGAEE